MVDDFFWEVMFILDTVFVQYPKDSSSMCVFNPGVLVKSNPSHPKLLPFFLSVI